MGIFILKPHNGQNQIWFEIDTKELKKWMKDGSIEEDDLIIFPNKVKRVVSKKELMLIKEHK